MQSNDQRRFSATGFGQYSKMSAQDAVQDKYYDQNDHEAVNV